MSGHPAPIAEAAFHRRLEFIGLDERGRAGLSLPGVMAKLQAKLREADGASADGWEEF